MHVIAFILVIVGGLNWLLYGIFQSDIFMWLGLDDSIVSTIVYILVGLSALYLIFTHKKDCMMCAKKMGGGMGGGQTM